MTCRYLKIKEIDFYGLKSYKYICTHPALTAERGFLPDGTPDEPICSPAILAYEHGWGIKALMECELFEPDS